MARSLARSVGRSFGRRGRRLGVKDAVLTVFTPGARTPGALASGTNPTSTTHACKGFVRAYDAHLIDGTIIKADDRRIALFASEIAGGAVPVQGAKITIEGDTYFVVSVRRDPASVLYICHGRR